MVSEGPTKRPRLLNKKPAAKKLDDPPVMELLESAPNQYKRLQMVKPKNYKSFCQRDKIGSALALKGAVSMRGATLPDVFTVGSDFSGLGSENSARSCLLCIHEFEC